MSTKVKKSDAVKALEKMTGGPLTFGRLLRSIRMGEELTLKDFSKSLDISIQHLSDIENDRRVVSPERAAKFAGLLGYSEAQFVELAVQDMLNHSGLENLRVKVS
ncbi:MAG: helix-turn-helix transcriptional regulator [Bdellovibrionaceae bacterium]|nr:helix-turn-helix transcriptional regulator [Pseudobdellovibrionaceae bacterium]